MKLSATRAILQQQQKNEHFDQPNIWKRLSYKLAIWKKSPCAHFGSTYTKIGTIERDEHGTRRPGVLRFMGSQSRTWLSDWTELNCVPPAGSQGGSLSLSFSASRGRLHSLIRGCSPPASSVHGILQNTGVGSHSLLQGIFLTQESNPAGRFFTV